MYSIFYGKKGVGICTQWRQVLWGWGGGTPPPLDPPLGTKYKNCTIIVSLIIVSLIRRIYMFICCDVLMFVCLRMPSSNVTSQRLIMIYYSYMDQNNEYSSASIVTQQHCFESFQTFKISPNLGAQFVAHSVVLTICQSKIKIVKSSL